MLYEKEPEYRDIYTRVSRFTEEYRKHVSLKETGGMFGSAIEYINSTDPSDNSNLKGLPDWMLSSVIKQKTSHLQQQWTEALKKPVPPLYQFAKTLLVSSLLDNHSCEFSAYGFQEHTSPSAPKKLFHNFLINRRKKLVDQKIDNLLSGEQENPGYIAEEIQKIPSDELVKATERYRKTVEDERSKRFEDLQTCLGAAKNCIFRLRDELSLSIEDEKINQITKELRVTLRDPVLAYLEDGGLVSFYDHNSEEISISTLVENGHLMNVMVYELLHALSSHFILKRSLASVENPKKPLHHDYVVFCGFNYTCIDFTTHSRRRVLGWLDEGVTRHISLVSLKCSDMPYTAEQVITKWLLGIVNPKTIYDAYFIGADKEGSPITKKGEMVRAINNATSRFFLQHLDRLISTHGAKRYANAITKDPNNFVSYVSEAWITHKLCGFSPSVSHIF